MSQALSTRAPSLPAHPGGLPTGISVVVPVYNSEQSLTPLAERLEPVLQELAGAGCFELILVNDGSRDNSWATVQALAERFAWVHGFDLMRNFGQHNALLCGLREARFDVTVTMDDDLQHPPEELPKLIEALGDDVDVVYGDPQRQKHGLLRDLASSLTKLALSGVMGAETAQHASALRVLRTGLRDAFAGFRGNHVAIDVLLTWGTQRFDHRQVRHDPRAAGASNYTVVKLVRHAFTLMTGFTTMPLVLATWMGFFFTLFGIGVLGYVLVNYLIHGQAVPGFAFLASVVALFSGAQLFSLGIIGEYLARMHVRLLDRPTYVVRPARPHDVLTPPSADGDVGAQIRPGT